MTDHLPGAGKMMQAEPVAWMTRFDDPERGSYGKPADTHLKRDEAERQVQRHADKRLCRLRIEPLYTHPQPPHDDTALLAQCLEVLDGFGTPDHHPFRVLCDALKERLK